jgi:hypothetical protein
MLRKWLGVFCILLMSLPLKALTDQELLSYLRQNISSLPTRGSLIQSFSKKDQSYIYDQALAIMAFSHAGDFQSARSLMQGLKSLQLPDGSLYFSYYLDGKSPYPEDGDLRYSGAIAWVAMAAATFQHSFASQEFLSFNQKILTYLSDQMRSSKYAGQSFAALPFAPTNLSQTSWNENDVAALEHNVDAYAAFSLFQKLNPDPLWKQRKEELEVFITLMWDSSRKHFWSGFNFKDKTINQDEFYLDNQSWSFLAISPKMLKTFSVEALSKNCEWLLTEHEGKKGFFDSRPTNRPSAHKFIWSEGTAGQIQAMKRIKKNNCGDTDLATLEAQLKEMKNSDGGIAYATTSKNPDFTTASSVAGTTWTYFVIKDFNPFRPFSSQSDE